MGMTPLPGLVMGSRSGDIDPAVVIYLARQGMSIDEIDNLLNKKSGLLGVGTINSGDMRDIVGAAAANNDGAARALDMFVHRLVFYIGAYHTLLGGADAIVFTGGIGENGDVARGRVAQRLWGLGVRLDAERNKIRGQALVISRDSSAVKLLVMPTNEELMIARESLRVLKNH
jgi:acetate kinase